jgi:hypothetical protein
MPPGSSAIAGEHSLGAEKLQWWRMMTVGLSVPGNEGFRNPLLFFLEKI